MSSSSSSGIRKKEIPDRHHWAQGMSPGTRHVPGFLAIPGVKVIGVCNQLRRGVGGPGRARAQYPEDL